ncbi:2-oxoglutarate dehydrogenase complex dihydrolipoyllysine-residue succinyltransferase [Bacillaceae bacterium Marseille-Q3522]|nr:2-oxoglutarate dehydrogenase complex dihydrolipoyllysine-residue succinyltransferase [Bacillaceae bacterium Marseille-Q3522]
MAEILVPELAESITEGTIAQWLKHPGEAVKKGDYILELETDKVNVEIISDYEGVLKETLKDEGDTVSVGEAIAVVEEGAAASAVQAPPVKEEKTAPEQAPVPEKVTAPEKAPVQQPAAKTAADITIASPAARKLARERGIDLNQVSASDPLGRVRKQDVSNFTPEKQAAPAPAATPQATVSDKPYERVKMSRRRRTIANRLVEVQHTAAMLTTFNEVDMTAIMNLRKKRKDAFVKEHDVKLGFMSFFTKAVVGGLKKFPLLNAEIQGDDMIVKKYYDIGIAVAASEGLVVPVVRDADRKTFAEIEKEIAELAAKARNNKLSLSELQGGGFTITNGGIFGSLLSTPIINGPQVGILGMHGIQKRPVVVNDTIEIRPMMYIALSYDHRIVDGAEAVSFLVQVKKMLEDPETLLLEA